MGKRWLPLSVLSFTLCSLVKLTVGDVNFVPNFYDPKYHDDGRDGGHLAHQSNPSESQFNSQNIEASESVANHNFVSANNNNNAQYYSSLNDFGRESPYQLTSGHNSDAREAVSVTKAESTLARDYFPKEGERSWGNSYSSVPLFHADAPSGAPSQFRPQDASIYSSGRVPQETYSNSYSSSSYSSNKGSFPEYERPLSSYYNEESRGVKDSFPLSAHDESGSGAKGSSLSSLYTKGEVSGSGYTFPQYEDGGRPLRAQEGGASSYSYGKPSATYYTTPQEYNAMLEESGVNGGDSYSSNYKSASPQGYTTTKPQYPNYSNEDFEGDSFPYTSIEDYNNPFNVYESLKGHRSPSYKYGSYKPPIPSSQQFHSLHNDPYKNHGYGIPYDLRVKSQKVSGMRVPAPQPFVNTYRTRGQGWAKSPPYQFPTPGYKFKYSTLFYPGTVHTNLPFDMENEPPSYTHSSLDCENRHFCSGGKGQQDLTSLVSLTKRPRGRRRPRRPNSLFKRLIRNIVGKNKRKSKGCKGPRCHSLPRPPYY